jgi:eukaryotic-like serine/threonine-protein kinase
MKLCAVCQQNYEDDVTFCPRDGEVLQESPESIVGRVIDGKYEVESFIAQGGMGAVYLARHILLGDRVVIKTLRSEMRTNAEWLRRFQREGKAARAFRHPNSVTVYDLSAGSDGLIYMVMEYVEGHTLDKELKQRRRLTPLEAVEVLEPVADALDAAHARGVVHRDLKPENIMLGRDERGERQVKVLDLGIAKLIGGEDAYAASATVLTTAGQILGTPYYMSPEQWGELPRDGRAEVDGRTDVYSLGVITFELVAGRKPLSGQTLAELRQKHVVEPAPALEEAAPGVPREFGRAVARATAKDRADRPPTAGEFIDELRAALRLPLRSRVRGPARPADPAQDARQTLAGGEADTAHLPADALEQSRANTLLTSKFEKHATGGGHGSASVETRPSAPGSRRGGGRETVTSGAVETILDAPGARADVQGQTDVPGQAAAAPPRRRRLAPLVLGGMLALLLVAALGAWLAWRPAPQRVEERIPPAVSAPAGAPAPPPPAPKVEVMSYWLEAFDLWEDEAGRRVAETSAALPIGQFFRFHLNPRRRGYLYIVGLGKGNAHVMFLTAQGAGPLKSNLAVGDADLPFPPGKTKLQLVEGSGTDDYTVIFSPTPLDEPSFLTKPSGYELTRAEVTEFEEFRARHHADASALEVREEGGGPRVVVSAPGGATRDSAPVIFDIRIRHL